MANIKAARRKNWEFISGIAAFVRQVEVLYGFETRGSRRAKQYWPVLPESARRKYREKARQ